MSIEDDLKDSKYGEGFARAVYGIYCAYEALPELPAYSIVKKGDILQATQAIDADPLFRNSNIIILGIDDSTIVGTSLRKRDRFFLARGTWSVEQLNNEIVKRNYWEIIGSLGKTSLDDYIIQQNTPGN